MTSWPCVINDRDAEMRVIPLTTDHLSGVRKEAMMIFYSDVEEVKTIEDMIKNGCKIIVLMRGIPGSGKTTLARYLMEKSADTSAIREKHLFSADDYFIDPKSNAYVFNSKFLRKAHSWNVEGVLSAAQANVTPIIVDNTNLTLFEMWPYACIAAKYDYVLKYLEPSTHWRYNSHECVRRNLHGVSEKHIATMMGRFDRSVSESELLSLASCQFNSQQCCDTHSNCRRAITRYSQQKYYAENCCTRQLHSICVSNDQLCKRPSIHSDSFSSNVPKVLLDPTNILMSLRTSRLPVTQQFVTSFPCSSEFVKFPFSGGILSIHPTCNIRKQHQTCKSVSLRNNVLRFYDQVLKWMFFLRLLVFARNVAICAAQFMSMCDKRESVEKCSPLPAHDSIGQYGCVSTDNKLRMILTVEHSVRPTVNINNIKAVIFPTNIRFLFLPAPRSIRRDKGSSEVENQTKKNKRSHISYTGTAERFPSFARICNVEGRTTCCTNRADLEDSKNIPRSWGVYDNSESDPWNVSDRRNYDPWDVSTSGCNSWDMCGNISWETETILTQHITQNELDCTLPKPPRTGRKASSARHSREQNSVKIERKSGPTISTTEVEINGSLPKPQRTNRRPRIMQYSCEEYASKLEPKTTLPPELEEWNAVDDPLSSWERKQSTESGNKSIARESHKSQDTSPASGNISVKKHTVPPASAEKEEEEEEEQPTSKPQREKRIRNRQ